MVKNLKKHAHGKLQTSQTSTKIPPCKLAFQTNTCGSLTKNQLEQVTHGSSLKSEQRSGCQLQSTDANEKSGFASHSTPVSKKMEQLPCVFQSRYVNVRLRRDGLWQTFHKTGTEMILTKTGRYVYQCPFRCLLHNAQY